MRKLGITLVEILVIVSIVGILSAVLYPTVRPRVRFTRTQIPPVSFQNIELEGVVNQLTKAIQNNSSYTVKFSKRCRWNPERLKHRRITLQTQQTLTLKEVLHLVEQAGEVNFDNSNRDSCIGAVGSFVITDTRKSQTTS